MNSRLMKFLPCEAQKIILRDPFNSTCAVLVILTNQYALSITPSNLHTSTSILHTHPILFGEEKKFPIPRLHYLRKNSSRIDTNNQFLQFSTSSYTRATKHLSPNNMFPSSIYPHYYNYNDIIILSLVCTSPISPPPIFSILSYLRLLVQYA